MTTRPFHRLAAAAVLVTLLGACTGDAEPAARTSPSPASSPSAPPAAAPSPSPTVSPSPSPSPPPAVREHAGAGELAADLAAAEQAIRDPDIPPAHLRGWAHVQHAAYRELHDHPDWVGTAAAALPAGVRPAFEANLTAQSELFALTDPREQLPDWQIVPAPPADELLGHYRSAADELGIDWTYLAAIHFVESRMGRIRGTSTAGAQGPMQFLPSTWEAYGEGDIQDPHDAIRAAARYLVAHGAPGDMHGALWAYNHSDRYVTAISAYAGNLRREPVLYHAYYHWRVYYRLVTGDVVLEEGWSRDAA